MGEGLNRINPLIGGHRMVENEKLYTIEDIEALPEGERAELIDGVMYMMASPTITHQRICGYIFNSFYNYIQNNNGNCEVFMSPVAVYLSKKHNYVEPDIMIICNKDILDDKGCHGGPDLVVEVVSKSSVKMDYLLKLFKYAESGVREYWVVDSESKRIWIYHFEKGEFAEYTFEDSVPVGIYDGEFKIDFSKMNI